MAAALTGRSLPHADAAAVPGLRCHAAADRTEQASRSRRRRPLGSALVGSTVLYWWPDDGWQRGTVARLCPRGAFSHVVAST